MTWLAIAPCGCVRIARVENGRRPTALLRQAEPRGYRVVLVPTEDARQRRWRCGQPWCPFVTQRLLEFTA